MFHAVFFSPQAVYNSVSSCINACKSSKTQRCFNAVVNFEHICHISDVLMQHYASNRQYHKQLYFHCSYMVDAADLEKVEASKNELHSLIDKPQLHGIPVSSLVVILT